MVRSLASRANAPAALSALVRSISTESGMQLADILGPNRSRRLFHVRRTIALEARERGYSFPQIGRALNRDHSTIVHAVRG
jgi:chromosomal replication initiation ATPase DnaA